MAASSTLARLLRRATPRPSVRGVSDPGVGGGPDGGSGREKRGGCRPLYRYLSPTLESVLLGGLRAITPPATLCELEVKWTDLTRREISQADSPQKGTPDSQHVVCSVAQKARVPSSGKASIRRPWDRVIPTVRPVREHRPSQAGISSRPSIPSISMDTKKKELLGNFYRDGKLYTAGGHRCLRS